MYLWSKIKWELFSLWQRANKFSNIFNCHSFCCGVTTDISPFLCLLYYFFKAKYDSNKALKRTAVLPLTTYGDLSAPALHQLHPAYPYEHTRDTVSNGAPGMRPYTAAFAVNGAVAAAAAPPDNRKGKATLLPGRESLAGQKPSGRRSHVSRHSFSEELDPSLVVHGGGSGYARTAPFPVHADGNRIADSTAAVARGTNSMTDDTATVARGTNRMADDTAAVARGANRMTDNTTAMARGTNRMTDDTAAVARGANNFTARYTWSKSTLMPTFFAVCKFI